MTRVLALILVTLGLTPSVGAPPAVAAPTPVVLILLENHSRSAITAAAAPYLTSFANAGRKFTHYNAIEHPSLPNYLDIVSGGNQGCRNDACPRRPGYTANNLFNQVGDWQAWNEAATSNCQLNSHGRFAVKHSPSAYFRDLISTCPQRDIPWPSPIPNPLHAFTFATPDLCHDMHDCSVRVGDDWARANVPGLLSRGAIVVIVFDEGSGSQNVFAAIRGPGISPSTNTATFNHYSLLAGLEDHFGLSRLGHAAGANPLPI